MRVTVRLLAIGRQQAGWRERVLELPAGATIDDAWRALVALVPALAASREIVRFARNRQYAQSSELLAGGDEVGLTPPVAGGGGGSRGRTPRRRARRAARVRGLHGDGARRAARHRQ